MSPRRKKRRTYAPIPNSLKRPNENEENTSKRSKAKPQEEDIQALRRKNFVKACEQVSCNAYCNLRVRLLLLSLPTCIENGVYKNDDSIVKKEIPYYAVDTFKIDIRANMWCDALEVCSLCSTPTEYLSGNMLKEIVEIIMNAHYDEFAEHTIEYLISQCQFVFIQNLSTHPPCLTKSVNQTYIEFLTSPMDSKENTFTNRAQFGYTNGVVKYCLNRLEYELSADSPEGSIVDKDKNTPEDMRQSIKGLHWQKEKFEIYECLERTDRIERLMAVLEIIIELLQTDLAVWQYRYTSNMSTRILMPKNRPLMTHILWYYNVVYTGTLSNECRQIIRIFAHMVHLKCPDKHVKIIAKWLNVVIQVFYILETNSNSDYPNIGKYSLGFANTFYKIIEDMPHESIIRIIEMVHPAYMKYLIGTNYLKKLLDSDETCILKNLSKFLKESQWEQYPQSEGEIELFINPFQQSIVKNKLRYFCKMIAAWNSEETPVEEDTCYPKIDRKIKREEEVVTCNHVIHALYVTFQAYLHAYSVQDIQETIDDLNDQLEHEEDINIKINETLPVHNSYSVTEAYIKHYRYIYQMLKELLTLFQTLKDNNHGEVPDLLKVFKNLDLFDI